MLTRDLIPLFVGPLERERLEIVDTGSGVVEVVPPEYVVLSKLLWYRDGGSPKHVRDIRSLIAVQGEALDLDEIRRRAEALGLADVWREVAEG